MALHTLNTCSWVENPLLRMQLDIPVLFKYKTETHEIKDLPKLNNFKALNRKEQLFEIKCNHNSRHLFNFGVYHDIVLTASNIVLLLT